MATLKESQKRARMNVALAGLRWFYRKEGASSLDDIFGNDIASTDLEVSETVTAKGRKWQREMMQRLINDGVVVGANGLYSILAQDKLASIIQNANNDGAMLARYVFPGQVSASKAVEVSEPVDVDAVLDAASVPVSGDSHGSNGQEIVALFNTMIDQIGKNHQQFDESLRQIDLSSSEQLGLTHKLTEQVTQRERYVGRRIDELEQRLAATQRVVESMQTTLKSTQSALGVLNETSQSFGATLITLEATNQNAKAINAKLDALIVRLDRTEEDQLGKLLRQLKLHTEESAVLYELIMDISGKSSSGDKS